MFSRFRWVLWRLQSIVVSLTLPGVILTPLILLFGFSFIQIDLTFSQCFVCLSLGARSLSHLPSNDFVPDQRIPLAVLVLPLIHDYESWSRQPFVSFGRSLGMGADQQLRKILLLKPWLQAFCYLPALDMLGDYHCRMHSQHSRFGIRTLAGCEI